VAPEDSIFSTDAGSDPPSLTIRFAVAEKSSASHNSKGPSLLA